MEGQDLRLAAPGEQQQAQGGHVQGAVGLVPAQHCGEAAILLGGQEALGPPLPVAADAGAGVAVLRAVSPGLGLLHDDREDRRRAVRGGGRRVEPAEPGPHVLPGYLSDGPAREEGQDLPAEVGPVHVHGARLPAAPVAVEDLLGDRLEEGAAGVRRPSGSRPSRSAASIDLALARASGSAIAAASPMIFQTRLPLCWLWMK